MGVSEFIYAAIPIFLSIMIPGLAIAYPLLKRTKLSMFEITCFGFSIGLVIPPTVSFIANIIGIPYSFELFLASLFLSTLGGILWFAYEYSRNPEKFGIAVPEVWFSPMRDAVPLVLLFIMVTAFFLRIQSIGPIFYEFDPYYYIYIARQLLVLGYVPTVDWMAWYPNPSGHGNILLTGYLEAGWYHIYTGGTGVYDNILLSTIANVYPPVVATLVCFFVYILLKEEYGKITGLVGAGLIAITPRLIEKTVAGEAEIMPWGIFSTFFFLAAYAIAIKRHNHWLSILAGIAYLSTVLGSAYVMVVTLVLVGYSMFETLKYYLKGKSLKFLLETNAIVVAFGVFSYIIQVLGYSRHWDVLSLVTSKGFFPGLTWVLMLITMIVGMGALYYVELNSKKKETRYNVLVALAIVSLFIFLLSPLSSLFLSYLTNAISFAKPTSALMQTVAEEHKLSPAEFQGLAKPSYGLLGDLVSMGIPGVSEATGVHVPVLLVMALIWLLYAYFSRWSNLALLFMVAIFPIAYVGVQKSKYTVQFGFVLVIATAVVLGELYLLFRSFINEKEKKSKSDDRNLSIAYSGLACLLLLAAASIPFSDVLPTALTFEQPDCNDIYKDIVDGKDRRLSYYIYCSRIPAYWLDSMEWISENVGQNSRVISWWDYGHWINFFGDRPCITRNEHAFSHMDLEVANSFVSAPPEGLKQYMVEHNATHALFDMDLVGKWGALKYLSCVYSNQTNMSQGPAVSDCDALYDFEYVFIPIQPTLEERCIIKDQPQNALALAFSSFGNVYCVAETQINGEVVPIMYNAGETNPPNNFDLSKATINRGTLILAQGTNIQGRQFARFMVLYTGDGFEDRKGKGYDSNFYKGFFLGELDGFELVYPENDRPGWRNVPVRIFEIKE